MSLRRRPPLVSVIVACLLPVSSGIALPECSDSALPRSINAIQQCQQETLQLREQGQCSGAAARLCCTTLDSVLSRQCHCTADVSADDVRLLEQLHQHCTSLQRRITLDTAAPRGVKLFVGVLTAGKNHLARQAVRDTWGSDPRLHRVLFFAAKPQEESVFDALRQEAVQKGDIVVLPTIWEGYYNITHQTLEVLRAAALDREATHVLKVDDDSYVRVSGLLDRVSQAPKERLLLGFVENPGGGPHRNPSSQWHVTPDEWASERYPPWAHGAGYVITQDFVREIAAGAALKPQAHRIFKLEDIAVGSWIEFVAGERRWQVNYVRDTAFNFNGCAAYDLVSHYVKPRAMRCMFRNRGACCTASSLRGAHLRGHDR